MAASEFRTPITLRGRYVDLVPLSASHIEGLAYAGRDPEVWRLLRVGPGGTVRETTDLVEELLAEQSQGEVLPFTVVARWDERPLGIFRYLHIGRYDRKVETGTWLDSDVWRTPVNSEVKYLGLRHAFEVELYHRVELRTDSRNERSRLAIERLGAVREGVHRGHYTLRDGSHRTSLVYSILVGEWPRVKAVLEDRLARPWSPKGLPPTPSSPPGRAGSTTN